MYRRPWNSWSSNSEHCSARKSRAPSGQLCRGRRGKGGGGRVTPGVCPPHWSRGGQVLYLTPAAASGGRTGPQGHFQPLGCWRGRCQSCYFCDFLRAEEGVPHSLGPRCQLSRGVWEVGLPSPHGLYLRVTRPVASGRAHAAGAPISPVGQEDQKAPIPATQYPHPLLGLSQRPPSLCGTPQWGREVGRQYGGCPHMSPLR